MQGALQILIADDSEPLRRTLKQLLKADSARWAVCAETFNGQDTIRHAAELDPDVVLLDLSIPKPSGMETARVLAKERPGMAVVLMSAQEPDVLERIAQTVSASYSISKAALSEELIPLLESIAAERQSARAAAP